MMVDRLTEGPVQILSLDVASINWALRDLSERLDKLKGLRGRSEIWDRVRIDDPEEEQDSVSQFSLEDTATITWDTTTPTKVRANTAGAAPDSAEYIVGAAHANLGAERVATDTTTVDVDMATAGQAKWNVLPAGVDHNSLANLAVGDVHTQYQLEAEKDAANGYAGLSSVSRTTKGVDTTDDMIIDLATKGLVLKDTQGTPHYWRVSVTTLGVLTTADLGTTKP